MSYHAGKIPKKVFWYCDPAGANERAELRCADFKVVKGKNAIRPGIAAVSARIQSGRLRILPGQCPNLLMEAGLYRYDPRLPDAETPLDEHNHAMDALRYLISGLGFPLPRQTQPRRHHRNKTKRATADVKRSSRHAHATPLAPLRQRGIMDDPIESTPFAPRKDDFSFPGSAWERTAWQAPPARDEFEAEPLGHCVPRRSLGTSETPRTLHERTRT